jgi:putative membrane protein
LPITVFTLGIFLLFINAGMLYLTAWVIEGFNVNSYLDALLASIVISIVTAFLNHMNKSD